MKNSPGTRFEYCNGAFVVLALVIEALTGSSYYDVLVERVFLPARMTAAAFLRSDQLPGSGAIDYVEDATGWRTNHFTFRCVGRAMAARFQQCMTSQLSGTPSMPGSVPLALVEDMTEHRTTCPQCLAMAPVSGCDRTGTPSCWRDRTRACRSVPHTTRLQDCSTPLWRTPRVGAWPIVEAA
jgi:CubicO group peptidase (beta-lactamase class C family)